MMPITIGFSRPKGSILPVFSWLIRLVEWTPYSHVYIRYWDPDLKQELILEAQGASVKASNWENRKKDLEEVKSYTLFVSHDECCNIREFAMSLTGVSYGYGQIIGIGIVKLAYAFGKVIQNPFSTGKDSMVCSEFVGYILKEILQLKLPADLDSITPKQIDQYLERL